MPAFLNSLYQICIGVAVVIAILQLIRGGITWMLADSFTSKESARHSITIAIMGLILVLSPYLVFSVINPKILDLSISKLTLTVPDYTNGTRRQSLPPGGGVSYIGTYVKSKFYDPTDIPGQEQFEQTECAGFENIRRSTGADGIVKVYCFKTLQTRIYNLWNRQPGIEPDYRASGPYPIPTDYNRYNQYRLECSNAGLIGAGSEPLVRDLGAMDACFPTDGLESLSGVEIDTSEDEDIRYWKPGPDSSNRYDDEYYQCHTVSRLVCE